LQRGAVGQSDFRAGPLIRDDKTRRLARSSRQTSDLAWLKTEVLTGGTGSPAECNEIVRSTDEDCSEAEGARRRGLGSVRVHYRVARVGSVNVCKPQTRKAQPESDVLQ
jgi:hypothetical protein